MSFQGIAWVEGLIGPPSPSPLPVKGGVVLGLEGFFDLERRMADHSLPAQIKSDRYFICQLAAELRSETHIGCQLPAAC